MLLLLKDFCTPGSEWPPKSEMKILKGKTGESCKTVCYEKGICSFPLNQEINM